jgi:Family of unknown function (DUF5824)
MAQRQRQLIKESKENYEKTGLVEARPKVSAKPTPRSSHAVKFENKYGYKVGEINRIHHDFPDTNVDGILAKGRAAYASSGSRPNVTPEQWAKARLASVLTGGKALNIDKDLVGPKSLARIRS